MLVPLDGFEWIVRSLLIGVGLFAGFFYVPLAVFMQARPPAALKGRMIGAMNLINWIGIVLAAVFWGRAEYVCDAVLHVRLCWVFAMCALVMLPVALFYRPDQKNDAGGRRKSGRHSSHPCSLSPRPRRPGPDRRFLDRHVARQVGLLFHRHDDPQVDHPI